MAEYMSVSEALKLMSPFKKDKREVLAFISNVDTAFEAINPENSHILYKSVLTRISGEPQVAITHRNLENWDDLRTFLKKRVHGKTDVPLRRLEQYMPLCMRDQ